MKTERTLLFEIIFDPYNYPFWIFITAVLVGAMLVISRPFSTYVKFAYPNARFEAVGNPFIKDKELNRLLDSKDLSEFKDSLNTLKDYDITGKNSQEIQQSLDDALIQTVDISRKDSAKKMNEFYDIYLEKIDAYMIKNELKNKLNGKEIDKTVANSAILPKTKQILEELAAAEKDKIPEILKNYGFGLEVTDAVLDDENDFLALDTAIDKHIIERLQKAKLPHNCEKGKQKFVKRTIDINNIKRILRAKQLSYDEKTCLNLFLGDGQEIAAWKFKEMAQTDKISQIISSLEGTSYFDILKDSIEEYNKERSVQVLENSLDRLYLKLVEDISTQNYVNIGPTIRFLVSKEFEIRNLKIIAKGIGENMHPDTIKNFLIMEAN
jgi:V/A-type H+-transporting ATPase subunit C